MSQVTFQQLLDSLPDADARRYIEVAIHSDLATEPDLTSATYGQQNWLMNHPDYMRLYSIDGGLEKLPRELARRLRSTNIRLSQPVISVEPLPNGQYLIRSQTHQGINESTFDFVVTALPNNWISAIDWRGASLSRAMRQHVAHYRHPAHYLRVSLLYDYPFWREQVNDSYFMIDAFGGCCVYDESARHGDGIHGILGMLIAGESALTLANLDDARLVEMARRALPAVLGEASAEMLEAKVHRWLGAVSALPGGRVLADPDSRHIPDPVAHPWLFVVGDYLFDTTLNGVLDSADTVVEMLAEEEEEYRSAGGDDEPAELDGSQPVRAPEPVVGDAPIVGRLAMSPLASRGQDVS